MEYLNNYRKSVGLLTILSGIVGFISYFLVASSVNFNFDFFSNPVLIFAIPDVQIGMLRWSMIADIFGYYLLLLPALFYLHDWLHGKTKWRNLITFCGSSYVLLGAVGASILAVAWPTYLTKFPLASPDQQETIKLLFESFSLMVGDGIWNLFDSTVFGIWLVAIGIFIKNEKSILGWVTIILGIISLLDGFGNMLEAKALAEIAVNLYLVLAPSWAIALGFAIFRNKIALPANQ